jgi:beta-glucanase (GH16 family)
MQPVSRMAMEHEDSRSVRRGLVNGLTRSNMLGVASLTLLAGAAMPLACSSSRPDVSQDFTSKPPPGQTGDFDASVILAAAPDAATPVSLPPEGTLCEPKGPPARTAGDVLVYADEFDGTAVDTAKWNVANGPKGHDGILNTSAADHAVVHDGILSMVTARTSDPAYPYVSGYIDSLGKFARTYGKVEFRARFPYAAGVWYAMWGRPWWQSFPEIDIEVVNRTTDPFTELYFVNHWAAPPLPADERRRYVMMEKDVDYSQFHIYTIFWTPDVLEWRIDGVPKMQSTPATKGVPTDPVYWIINGWVGGWTGNPDEHTPLPVSFDVDYMRIYRVDGLIADPVVKVVSPKTRYSRNELITVVAANYDEACAHVQMTDGNTVVRTTAKLPYTFATTGLTVGAHHLSFTATDGVRATTVAMDVDIY